MFNPQMGRNNCYGSFFPMTRDCNRLQLPSTLIYDGYCHLLVILVYGDLRVERLVFATGVPVLDFPR